MDLFFILPLFNFTYADISKYNSIKTELYFDTSEEKPKPHYSQEKIKFLIGIRRKDSNNFEEMEKFLRENGNSADFNNLFLIASNENNTRLERFSATFMLGYVSTTESVKYLLKIADTESLKDSDYRLRAFREAIEDLDTSNNPNIIPLIEEGWKKHLFNKEIAYIFSEKLVKDGGKDSFLLLENSLIENSDNESVIYSVTSAMGNLTTYKSYDHTQDVIYFFEKYQSVPSVQRANAIALMNLDNQQSTLALVYWASRSDNEELVTNIFKRVVWNQKNLDEKISYIDFKNENIKKKLYKIIENSR